MFWHAFCCLFGFVTLRFYSCRKHAFAFTTACPWSHLVRRSVRSTWNPFKIDVPKNMRFFIEFCSKNALLQQRRHRFRIGFSNTFCLSGTFLQIAFRMHFGSKKPIQNPPKTRSDPLKNRCQKRCFFQHRFFRVSASILEPLGPPSPPRCSQRRAC